MNFPNPSLPSVKQSSWPNVPAVNPASAVVVVRNGGTTNGNQIAVKSDLLPPPPGFEQVNKTDTGT